MRSAAGRESRAGHTQNAHHGLCRLYVGKHAGEFARTSSLIRRAAIRPHCGGIDLRLCWQVRSGGHYLFRQTGRDWYHASLSLGGAPMRRREFIKVVAASGAAWPIASLAQQSAIPVVGLLRSTPAAPFNDLVVALREGLKENGFVVGYNVVLEQRWADNQNDRLPDLAADLVRHQAAVIIGNQQAIGPAKAASPTTPIIFVTGEDPVTAGLVASLSRPEGNLTGVTFFGGSQLNTKRIELLHEL